VEMGRRLIDDVEGDGCWPYGGGHRPNIRTGRWAWQAALDIRWSASLAADLFEPSGQMGICRFRVRS
jgi:hypothetical protein